LCQSHSIIIFTEKSTTTEPNLLFLHILLRGLVDNNRYVTDEKTYYINI